MKTLLIKELRENFKLGVIGLLLFTFLVLGAAFSYTRFIDAIAAGSRSPTTDWNDLHPLTSHFAFAVPWFCAVFAVLLGWLQIHNEKHRDLWAFLIHRPIPRAHIFWTKVTAGLTTYIIAAGFPLFLFILWMSIPGNVAAPFDWSMAWATAAWFLLGIVWYFAAMLTRIREARWYASRALGIGVALVATGAVLIPWNRWQITLVLVGCAALLAHAVWGAFHSHGHYEPQPAVGKAALTTAITFGTTLVVTFAAILVVYIFPGTLVQQPWTQYVMLYDGAIYKQTYEWGGTFQLRDLQGNVIKDVRTWDELQGRQPPGFRLFADPKANPRTPPFSFWDATPDTIWFYWTRYGKLFGFDLRTRQLTGTIGPAGFSRGRPRSGDRFEMPSAFLPASSAGVWHHTATSVYFIEVEKRTVHPVFTTATDDPILGVGSGGVGRLGSRVFRLSTAVLTRRSLQLIGPEDQIIWRVPFEQPRKEYTDVTISMLGTNGQFAVWVAPSYTAESRNPGKFPVYVTWFDRDQSVLKKAELPSLSSVYKGNTVRDKFMSVVMPPAVELALFAFTDDSIAWPFLLISLAIAAFIIVPLGVWVARRYNFSLRAHIVWAIFHMLSGLPGFLAFLAVHDWPARERCPNCNKLRAVNRHQCEHCAADFPSPSRDGTEIFEPLIRAGDGR